MTGKAASGTDYTLNMSSPATILAGQNSVTITVSALIDHVQEKKESATMTLNAGSGYSFGGSAGKKKPKKVKPPTATVSFIDTL
jgi:hypothetical protein